MRHNSYGMSAFPNFLTNKFLIKWIFMVLKSGSVFWLPLMHDSVKIIDTSL